MGLPALAALFAVKVCMEPQSVRYDQDSWDAAAIIIPIKMRNGQVGRPDQQTDEAPVPTQVPALGNWCQ